MFSLLSGFKLMLEFKLEKFCFLVKLCGNGVEWLILLLLTRFKLPILWMLYCLLSVLSLFYLMLPSIPALTRWMSGKKLLFTFILSLSKMFFESNILLCMLKLLLPFWTFLSDINFELIICDSFVSDSLMP